MSMIGMFAAADPGTLRRLRDDPDLVDEYLHPDDGDGEPPNSIDVDKTWHGIHYLLTGDAWGGEAPLSWAVMGGEEVGDDVGYGPARFLTPEQVRQVARALDAIGEAELRARYDPQAMTDAEIYPQIIWLREGKEALEYLLGGYEDLAGFYRDAAARGDGAILWIS